MVAIAGAFILGVIVMSWLFSVFAPGVLAPMLVGDVIALGVAYYFYILWERRPIRLACPKCEKIILSNTPWVCGVCRKPNLNTTEFPFVHKCGNPDCGFEPKAYRCHHEDEDGIVCGEMIYLSEERDKLNYAYCLNAPEEKSRSDTHTEKLQEMRESKEEIEMRRDIALVREDLGIIRERLRSQRPEKKSAKEVLQANVARVEELQEAGMELRAFYGEKYKGKKALRDRMIAAVDAEILRQSSEGK